MKGTIDFETSKRILNEGDRKYTDEEVKMISELLYCWAELTVQSYNELKNKPPASLKKS